MTLTEDTERDPVVHDTVSLRERKKLQTRQAIHDAAFRLIDEHGLDGTTIEQICQAADVSPRTFFNYFPSKVAAALDLPESAVDAEAADRFRAADGMLVDALCELLAGATDYGQRQRRVKAFVTRNPTLLPVLTQMMAAARGEILAIASERAASPVEAELAVSLVMAALAYSMHQADTSEPATVEHLRQRVDQLAAVRTAPLV